MHDRVKRELKLNEAAIEAELCLRAQMHGGFAEKVQAIGRRGFFDRIVFLPGGVIYFVELKRPRGGRLSPHQHWYRERLAALGVEGIVLVKNRSDIDALFEHYAARRKAGSVTAPGLESPTPPQRGKTQ
jgi:hypothetical protein